jgi:hypothetical protein
VIFETRYREISQVTVTIDGFAVYSAFRGWVWARIMFWILHLHWVLELELDFCSIRAEVRSTYSVADTSVCFLAYGSSDRDSVPGSGRESSVGRRVMTFSEFPYPHTPISYRSSLTWFAHLHLDLPSGLFLSHSSHACESFSSIIETCNIVTYRPTARQQPSIHGSSEHATMGGVFSVDECYTSLLGSTTILATEGGVFYVIRATQQYKSCVFCVVRAASI